MNFQAFFQQSSALMLVIDTKFTITSASDAFLNASNTVREKIIGQSFFNIFPSLADENSSNVNNVIRTSLNRVLETKTADKPAIVKYQIPNLSGDGYEEKYWKITHTPTFDGNHNVEYIIQVAENVTKNEILNYQVSQNRYDPKQIGDSEIRYNSLLMNSPFGFAVLRGENMVISLANDSIKEFWGKGKDVEGKLLFDIIPELKDSHFPNLLKEVYETGKPFYGDELLAPLIRNRKLEDVYFNFIYQPYLEADETISGVTIIGYEVTNEAIAKRKIADKEKQIQNIFNNAPAAIAVWEGTDLKYVLANTSYQKMTSRSEEQLLGKTMLEVFPEITGTGTIEIFENVLKTGKAYIADEYPVMLDIDNNGVLKQVYYKFTAEPIKDADGKFNSVMVLAIDVTEQIEARKKIEESEAFNSSVLNSSPDCIKILDTDGRLQYMNENGVSLLEIDDFNNFKNKFWWELWDEENQLTIKDAIKKAENGEKVQFQALGKTLKGTPKWWDIIVSPMPVSGNKISGILGVSRDITDFKEATLKVQEFEHRYQEMIYSSPSLILILNGEDLIVNFSNDAMLEVLGKGPDIINKPLLEVIPEIIEQGLGDLLLKVYRTGEPQYGYEFPIYLIRDGDQKLFHFTFVYQAQRNIKGEIVGVAVIAQEVTPQALLNQKIKAREAQFSLLVQQAPVAICVLRGKDLLVELANDLYLQIVDRDSDFIGKPLLQSLSELQGQGIKELLENVLKTGIPFYGNEFEVHLLRNGIRDRGYFNFVYQPLREADGTIVGIIAVVTEVTELVTARKKMEVQTALFEDMLMTAPGFVSTLSGPDHVFELVNEQYQSLFGKRPLKGKPIMEALPELKGQGFDELLNKVYTTGEPYVGIDIPAITAKDEGLVPELRYYNFSYQPMYNEFKEIYSILLFGYEVTEQTNAKKRIEESEKHFRQLADLMPAKISNADANGHVTYFNKQWFDYTGLDFEELKDLGYHNILHPDELEEFQNRFKKASETKTVLEMEMRILNKYGDYKWHLNLASPVFDENQEIKMWIGSTTEIHDQIQQKSTLKKAVQERTKDLERANNTLIFQNEEKEKRAQELNIVIRELAFQNEEKEKKSIELINLSKDLKAKQQELLNSNELLMKQDEKVSTINHELSLLNQELEQRVVNRTKALAESEIRFRNMMETIPQISWTNTVDGEFAFYNKRWYDYSGLNKKETKEFGPKSVIYPDDLETAREEYHSILKNGTGGEFQIRIKREDGAYRWHLIRLMPIKNEDENEVQLWAGTATDIQELRVLQQQKDDFISIASHELKTPITALKLSLQVMNRMKDNPSSALFPNLIERANISLNKVNSLVENLLNTSKANEKQIHLNQKPFVISKIVEDCCAHVRDEGTYTIKTIGDLDLEVYADAMRIDQVIINFVNNAIKYAPKSKEVIVKIEKLVDSAKVSVIDKGPGIDPEKLRHLFDKYYRVDSSGSQYSGLGLGLYISTEIVKRHNGQIGVDSELGKGCTFWFTLPL